MMENQFGTPALPKELSSNMTSKDILLHSQVTEWLNLYQTSFLLQSMKINSETHSQITVERVKDLETLDPKWDVLISSFQTGSGNPVEEVTERWQKSEGMEATKETRLYKHSSIDAHVDSFRLRQHAHTEYTGLGLPDTAQRGRGDKSSCL